jgi:large subunit ribosomal protein L1
MKHGKKYREIKKKFATHEALKVEEAVEKAKKLSYAGFTSSIDLHVAIKVPKNKDPKSIKGSVSLPYPVKSEDKKIYVFTEDKVDEALKAGATKAGLDELVGEVKKGEINFDIAIATPKVMSKIAVLGKELGPRGLMPNPKTGTVTDDIASTVEEFKKGRSAFKCDDSGTIHMSVGSVETETEKVAENIEYVIEKIAEVVGRPAHTILRTVHIAPTMGPSVKVDYSSVVEEEEK